jgi:murein L,D-transpeptidase YcbB/YkuD
VYFTAWVREDGTLRVHHDVYGHDEDLESQMDELDPDSAAAAVTIAESRD